MKATGKNLACRVTIVNELGLHARTAAKIAKIAQRAAGKVWIMKDGLKVDAVSIIDLLTLEGTRGSTITIVVDSPADAEILKELEQLVAGGFRE